MKTASHGQTIPAFALLLARLAFGLGALGPSAAHASSFDDRAQAYCDADLPERVKEEQEFLKKYSELHGKVKELRASHVSRIKILRHLQEARQNFCKQAKEAQMTFNLSRVSTSQAVGQCGTLQGAKNDLTKAREELSTLEKKMESAAHKFEDVDLEQAESNRKALQAAQKANPKLDQQTLKNELFFIWKAKIPGTLFRSLIHGLQSEAAELRETLKEMAKMESTLASAAGKCGK